MTDGEKALWQEPRLLKGQYGVHVRRQAPIGPYVADFAIHKHGLVIEVDGEHHFTSDGRKRDLNRDAWLADAGYKVIRINTGELAENPEGCVETVLHALGLR